MWRLSVYFLCHFETSRHERVYLGIILVNDQLDARIFFLIYLFEPSTCFEQPRAHYQENQFYQYNI
jgi:hypothetical protein